LESQKMTDAPGPNSVAPYVQVSILESRQPSPGKRGKALFLGHGSESRRGLSLFDWVEQFSHPVPARIDQATCWERKGRHFSSHCSAALFAAPPQLPCGGGISRRRWRVVPAAGDRISCLAYTCQKCQ